MSVKIIEDKGDSMTVEISPLISGDVMVREGNHFVFDLERITIAPVPFPLDWNHKEIIGQVTKVYRNDTGGINAIGEIVSAVPNDTAANIIFRLRGGMRMGASPTFGIDEALSAIIPDGQTQRVNGRDFVGPVEVTTAASLDGAAITPYPTDRNTLLSRQSFHLSETDANQKTHPQQGVKAMTEEVKDEKEKTQQEETKLSEDEAQAEGAGAEENPYPKHPDLKKFLDAFPDRNTAIEYYLRGMTLEEAQSEDYTALKEKRAVELSMAAEEDAAKEKVECSETAGEDKKDESGSEAGKPEEERKELRRSLAELSASNVQLKKTVAELSRRVQTLKSGTTGEAEPVGLNHSHPKTQSALSLAAAGIERRIRD